MQIARRAGAHCHTVDGYGIGKLRTLTLFVPGLFSNLDAWRDPAAAPDMPALGALLHRAACRDDDQPLRARLCQAFGMSAERTEIPVAALTHRLDFDAGHEGVWLRADPVCLRADLQRLLLFDAATFDLSVGERSALRSGVCPP